MSGLRFSTAVAVALLAAGAIAPGAAFADTDAGELDTLSLEALHNYALCAVKRTPDGAEKLLSMDRKSDEFGKELARYAKGHGYCTRNKTQLRFSGLPFAGDLAEALIAMKYEGRSIKAAAAAADAERMKEAPAAPAADGKPAPLPPSPRAFAEKHSLAMAEAVGFCVAMQKPEAVEALLQSSPNSDEELAALKPTGSVLPACVPEGQTLKLNRPAVRAMYALGAYRMLVGNPEHPEG